MPRFSRLAILTKFGLICYLILVLVLAYRISLTMPAMRGLTAIVLVAVIPILVIGMGILIPFVNNHRHHESASWRDAFRAWRSEVWSAIRAGMWWQAFRWRQYPSSTSSGPARSKADVPTVILLHGFVSNRGLWNPWLRNLQRRGVPFVCINLEPLFGSIDNYIQAIEAAVENAEQISRAKPIVICHSMGGLAFRKWLVSQPHARTRIGRIVTIGTPHQGTWMGRLSIFTNGREMRLGSEWIAELEAAERESRPEDTYAGFTCWYSNCDNIVIPAASAILPGAENMKIQGYGHLALAYHPRVMELDQYFPS